MSAIRKKIKTLLRHFGLTIRRVENTKFFDFEALLYFLLDADSKFLFLTVYAVRMSSLSLAGLLAEMFADLPGVIEHGDLAVREEAIGDENNARDNRTRTRGRG